MSRKIPRLLFDAALYRASVSRTAGEPDVEYWRITLTVPSAREPLTIEWHEPLVQTACIWTTAAMRNKALAPEWGQAAVSAKATSQAPVACAVGHDGQSRLCIASSDALFESTLEVGVLEETAELRCRYTMHVGTRPTGTEVDVTLRIDRRVQRYERILADVAEFWARLPGYEPAPVPEVAREAMYSTWYSFHQALEPARVEEQCRLAHELGCGAVIVDDGWQTLDQRRGYAYTGDWEPERIPDLAAHVKRVQALGMKFILWYSVPFFGKESRVFQRFRDKILYVHEPLGAGVWDPRFPDVREHVISTYERALVEYGLDGFKLDFVDRFKIVDLVDESVPGRDCGAVEEGVDRLLADVIARLRRIKPDVLIEFRQTYVGPLMRKYGNIFRAADCPADYVRNRISTIDVRLLCGSTACHADMLMWSVDEPAAAAALQLLSVLFSVPQISVLLDVIPQSHRDMLTFWLGFWRQHRATLLDGTLRADAPELNYPLVRADGDHESITALYAENTVCVIDHTHDWYVVNATSSPRVVLDLEMPRAAAVLRTFDACGRAVETRSGPMTAGLHGVLVPPSGLLSLTRAP